MSDFSPQSSGSSQAVLASDANAEIDVVPVLFCDHFPSVFVEHQNWKYI